MKNETKKSVELIFVVFEGYIGGLTAIEGNVGLVAMGDDDEALEKAIRHEVDAYYGDSFAGKIRMRKFTDKIIA